MPVEPDSAVAVRIAKWIADHQGEPVMIDVGTHDPDRDPRKRFLLNITTRLGRNLVDPAEDAGVLAVNVSEEPGASMLTFSLGRVERAKFDDAGTASLTIYFEDAGCVSIQALS